MTPEKKKKSALQQIGEQLAAGGTEQANTAEEFTKMIEYLLAVAQSNPHLNLVIFSDDGTKAVVGVKKGRRITSKEEYQDIAMSFVVLGKKKAATT